MVYFNCSAGRFIDAAAIRWSAHTHAAICDAIIIIAARRRTKPAEQEVAPNDVTWRVDRQGSMPGRRVSGGTAREASSKL